MTTNDQTTEPRHNQLEGAIEDADAAFWESIADSFDTEVLNEHVESNEEFANLCKQVRALQRQMVQEWSKGNIG